MRNRVIAGAFVLFVCGAIPARATTLQWVQNGVVGAPVGSGGAFLTALYPPGTPFSLRLIFDDFATNYALDPMTHGLYSFPGGQVTILGQTYFSSFTAFEINCPAASCPTGPGVFQQLNPFGPSTIMRWVGFGQAPFLSISLAFDESQGWINRDCVICINGLRWNATSFSIGAVPEPISVVLLGTGLAGIMLRRRGRR